MLNVFKKIWNFSKEEQVYIKKSILAGFLHAVFNALEFGAIYYMLVNICLLYTSDAADDTR